ncbi:MAG: SpoIID/LytB domain-containing protein [Bacillota bacterium]
MAISKRLALGLVLVGILFNSGCPGKEGTLFKNLVTRFGRPPEITVYMHRTNVKKRMDIEEYLAGVVAGEMKPGWPLNAYAAQAILARTFTMRYLGEGSAKENAQDLHGADISTDEKVAQAYNAANIRPVIREAVAKTKGLVLTYGKHYIKGWYHASSGGITAYAKEGLAYKEAEPPYISSVRSPEEKYTPPEELYWQTTLTSAEINAALKKLNGKEIGTVRKLEIVKRTKTQRAVLLKFIGDQGTAQVVGADFRVSYGPEKIRSIWISNEIVNRPGAIKIKGRGFGHGVGLSQWGAYDMAKRNWSPQKIVMHYYPKARVEKIW